MTPDALGRKETAFERMGTNIGRGIKTLSLLKFFSSETGTLSVLYLSRYISVAKTFTITIITNVPYVVMTTVMQRSYNKNERITVFKFMKGEILHFSLF